MPRNSHVPQSVEDDILAGIEEYEDAPQDTTPPDEGDTESQAAQQPSGAPEAGTVADTSGGTQTTPPEGTAPAPTQQQQPVEAQPQQQQQPRLWNHPTLKGYYLDADKHVVDAHGNVIARAGGERRWFENSQTLQTYMQQRDQYVGALEGRIKDMVDGTKEALDGIPQRLGLQRDDVELGLNLIANFKRDPVSVARYVLAEVGKLGYNVGQITGEPGSNSIDMQAIRSLLDERLGPVAQQRQEQETQETREQQALRQYNEFRSQFPDAQPHETEIAQLMQRNGITAQRAYFELRNWAAAQGLDWSQPLREQVVARMNGQQPQQGQQPNTAPSHQTRQQPLPNGGMPAGSVTNTPQYAQDDEDFDSIIKGAMAEAGMKY